LHSHVWWHGRRGIAGRATSTTRNEPLPILNNWTRTKLSNSLERTSKSFGKRLGKRIARFVCVGLESCTLAPKAVRAAPAEQIGKDRAARTAQTVSRETLACLDRFTWNARPLRPFHVKRPDCDGQDVTDTVTGGGNAMSPNDTVIGETIDDAFFFDAPWVNVCGEILKSVIRHLKPDI
jgi:hypothetical protein